MGMNRRCLQASKIYMPLLSRSRESQSTPSPLMRLSSRQGDVRLAPRAVFLDAQRSFFSSKKEEETAKAAPEEEKTELSEAEKALHERIAELQEKHDDVRIFNSCIYLMICAGV